ncbi:hypothetical protein [Pseudoalteromonas prydzensis]|uniref:hypothetical protein n=1 Tax=Pseudoalteromonas prydzensis TaxID=182141 RepID=UPI0024BC5935|nr:hypothetical protein [Pseudoalteromonas prydzensis]
MGNFNNNLIVKWRERFELLVRLTLGVPILLAGLQLALVGNQLSFDVTKLATWTNTEKVFALPLGVFALLAAVTSLIGLYHRSMLLNRQLEKVQEQIAISNKQFKRSDEQFKLAQEQFMLAQKQYSLVYTKENYVLYCEHKKQIEEHCEKIINGLRNREGIYYEIDYEKMYRYSFPENSYNQMDNFSLKSVRTPFEITEIIQENLERMCESLTPFMHPDSPSYKIDACFAGVGVYFFKPKLQEIEDPLLKIEIFLEATFEICGLLRRISIIKNESFTEIHQNIKLVEEKYKIA